MKLFKWLSGAVAFRVRIWSFSTAIRPALYYAYILWGSHRSFLTLPRKPCSFISFGTETIFSYFLVPIGQFWSISSFLLKFFFSCFRYRSINSIKLRPWNFLFSTFLWHLPRNLVTSSRKSCFCGTRICSNKASVPNSLPPGTQIECCASFFLSSMDETFPKIPFCTEILPLKATTTRLWQPEASRTPQPHKSCTHSPHLFAYWLGG